MNGKGVYKRSLDYSLKKLDVDLNVKRKIEDRALVTELRKVVPL